MRFLRRQKDATAVTDDAVASKPIQRNGRDPAEPGEIPEAPGLALRQTGLSGLLHRLRLRVRGAEPMAPSAAGPPPSLDYETGRGPVSVLVRLGLGLKNIRQEASLLLRRRTLTLSDEDGVIRAVVFRGREVLAWGIADPLDGDPFPVFSNGHLDARDIARVRMLFEELRLRRNTRFVTELPLYTPLVRHLRLPKVKRRFLEEVVSLEVADSIPFDQDEVDIKWDVRESATEQRVMAIAVQRMVVDRHAQSLKEAGRGPTSTYSQAAALALAAGVPDTMVVHIGRQQEAVILVRGGAPLAVHQVAKTDRGPSAHAQAERLARAVEQMEGYDQSLGATEAAERLPVVLTGQVPDDGHLEEQITEISGRAVLPLSPSMVCPAGFPVAEYATNVGLALLDRGRPQGLKTTPEHGASSLSLLSQRHVPRPVPYVAIAIFLVLGLFAVAALNITPRVNAVVAEAAAKADELDNQEREERAYRLSLGRSRKLQNDARDAFLLTEQLRSRLADLQEEIDTLGRAFERSDTIIEKTRPPSVIVAGLTPKGDQFELTGVAPTLDDAFEYVENIRDSGLFIDVSVRRVGEIGQVAGRGLTFRIEATAKPLAVEESDEPSE